MGFSLVAKSEEAEKFLKDYGYRRADAHIIEECIFEDWLTKKAGIRDVLKRHPKWDNDQQAIVFDTDIETGIDKRAISEFAEWALPLMHDFYVQERGVTEIDGENIAELHGKVELYRHLYDVMTYITDTQDVNGSMLRYGNLTRNNVRDLYRRFDDRLDEILENYYLYESKGLAITKGELHLWNKIRSFMTTLTEIECSLATPEFAEQVNELFPEVKATEGQKVSRIVNRIGKLFGLEKVKQMKSVVHNGVTQEKDFGWNYHFAAFADAVNPIKVHQYTVISINPFDYWTMSFGKNWASCHTIDKENRRNIRENHYHGCYSAGTESYMLDTSTIIMYTVDPDYVGEMWKAPKSRRCTFHMAKDGQSFIQGRLYPDGRDGGETGMAAQFRQIFQRVWSECQGEPNYWDTKKGVGECGAYAITDGHHYPDYENYNDCAHSIRKGSNAITIKIGTPAVCPCCGEEHDEEETITCPDCEDSSKSIGTCRRCGCYIYEGEDDYYEASDGSLFCCAECAEESDYVWCVNSDDYVPIDDAYYDPQAERYYDDQPDVITEDGESFYEEANAIAYGYVECVDGEWRLEEKCFYEEFSQSYYDDDSESVMTLDGQWFHDAETATAAGYYEDEDGEWVKEVA